MSDPDDMVVGIIWAIVVAGVLIAALVSRRIAFGRTLKMATAWIGIFGLVYGIALFRADLAAVWQRARDDMTGTRTATVTGRETIIRQDADGHYRITGTINDRAVRFLIDTGAGVTVIDQLVADSIGLERDQRIPRRTLMTAGGEVGANVAQPVTLQVGNIHRRGFVPWIGGHTDGTNVLGVDWLNRLSAWRMENGELHLVP